VLTPPQIEMPPLRLLPLEVDPDQGGNGNGAHRSGRNGHGDAGANEASREGGLLRSGLLRSAATVFLGNGLAKLFGFLFYIAAARLLNPPDYGTLAYALAILSTASILLTNSPGGLSRFLARNLERRKRAEIYYTNWLAVIVLMLVGSLVLFIPFSGVTGLKGWLLVGVIVNLLNIAIFETYVQVQRGLGRFMVIGSYYSLANFLQLVAILVAGYLGFRSASLFLIIYGLSAIAALVVMRIVAPTPLGLQPFFVYWRHILRISRYVAPIVAQGLFYAFWFSSDLILIQHLMNPTATANYSAAKTLTQMLILVPQAISMVASPRIARLSEDAVRRYLVGLLGLTGVLILSVDAGLILLQRPISVILYHGKYPHMLVPLNALIAGMAFYGLYQVMASAWGALGRPTVGAVATGFGTVATVTLALVLIPAIGLLGGGIAFAAGAATQLLVMVVYTVYGLYSGATARITHLPDEAMLSIGAAGR
jgi:O-antigen/teichoic acid export membrane protein